jgi:hypothetical protein
MGEKLGYIKSSDGTREKEVIGPVEEVDAKYEEVGGPAIVSEYNGGRASSGIGRVGGGAIARELELALIDEEDDRA